MEKFIIVTLTSKHYGLNLFREQNLKDLISRTQNYILFTSLLQPAFEC